MMQWCKWRAMMQWCKWRAMMQHVELRNGRRRRNPNHRSSLEQWPTKAQSLHVHMHTHAAMRTHVHIHTHPNARAIEPRLRTSRYRYALVILKLGSPPPRLMRMGCRQLPICRREMMKWCSAPSAGRRIGVADINRRLPDGGGHMPSIWSGPSRYDRASLAADADRLYTDGHRGRRPDPSRRRVFHVKQLTHQIFRNPFYSIVALSSFRTTFLAILYPPSLSVSLFFICRTSLSLPLIRPFLLSPSLALPLAHYPHPTSLYLSLGLNRQRLRITSDISDRKKSREIWSSVTSSTTNYKVNLFAYFMRSVVLGETSVLQSTNRIETEQSMRRIQTLNKIVEYEQRWNHRMEFHKLGMPETRGPDHWSSLGDKIDKILNFIIKTYMFNSSSYIMS